MPRMPRTLVGRVGTHVPLESAPQGVVDADLRDTRGEPGSAGFGMVSRVRPEADRSRPPPFRVFESGARLIAKHASDGEDPGDRNAPASCISRRTPRPRPPLSVRICPWRSPGADRACAPTGASASAPRGRAFSIESCHDKPFNGNVDRIFRLSNSIQTEFKEFVDIQPRTRSRETGSPDPPTERFLSARLAAKKSRERRLPRLCA